MTFLEALAKLYNYGRTGDYIYPTCYRDTEEECLMAVTVIDRDNHLSLNFLNLDRGETPKSKVYDLKDYRVFLNKELNKDWEVHLSEMSFGEAMYEMIVNNKKIRNLCWKNTQYLYHTEYGIFKGDSTQDTEICLDLLPYDINGIWVLYEENK